MDANGLYLQRLNLASALQMPYEPNYKVFIFATTTSGRRVHLPFGGGELPRGSWHFVERDSFSLPLVECIR